MNEQGELVDLRNILIPTSELAIEDTWFAAGMAATASNTFVANEVSPTTPTSRCTARPASAR